MPNLYNKYRPRDFEDVVEQGLVVKMVKKICEEDPLKSRNLLFIGSAGIGKTTISRIVARTLNDGSDNFIEIDAASHNSAESVREIVKQAQIYPIGCKYKVFIIDEVHCLSTTGWSILLKTLEESPAKSVFIMCTTNSEKIPATILSRVQTFQLSKISTEGINKRLLHVISKENEDGASITYEDNAVKLIARLANGGMRDAMTLLDRALVFSNNLSSENVVKALDLPNYDDYFSLLSAYAKKDNTAICSIIDSVYNSGINFVKWVEQFHSFIMNVLKFIFLQDIGRTVVPDYYLPKISKYSVSHAAICMKLSNKLVELIPELKTSPYMQEITLSYLCTEVRKESTTA